MTCARMTKNLTLRQTVGFMHTSLFTLTFVRLANNKQNKIQIKVPT